MKKTLQTFLLATIITGAVGCAKEDDDQNNNAVSTADKIEGDWHLTYYLDSLGSVNSQGEDPAFRVEHGLKYNGVFTFGSDNQIVSSTKLDYRKISDVRTLPPDTIYDEHTDYLNGLTWSVTESDSLIITMSNNSDLPFYITTLNDNKLEIIWEHEWSSAGYHMTEQRILKFEK